MFHTLKARINAYTNSVISDKVSHTKDTILDTVEELLSNDKLYTVFYLLLSMLVLFVVHLTIYVWILITSGYFGLAIGSSVSIIFLLYRAYESGMGFDLYCCLVSIFRSQINKKIEKVYPTIIRKIDPNFISGKEAEDLNKEFDAQPDYCGSVFPFSPLSRSPLERCGFAVYNADGFEMIEDPAGGFEMVENPAGGFEMVEDPAGGFDMVEEIAG